MKRYYEYEIKKFANQFTDCKSLKAVKKLGIDTNQLKLLSVKPPYYTFKLRKKGGGFRKIEAPEEQLKNIQHQLNHYLQSVYYTQQTKAAYGYIIKAREMPATKNILENARKHLGANYMLNVDYKNFFHQITTSKIIELLTTNPFQFEAESAKLLGKIMTRKGRLPMGTPTSPVLTNFVSIDLDNQLTAWAEDKQMTFTRYVDDLTFSSKNKPITDEELTSIRQFCMASGFILNPLKTTFYDKDDTKKVTGLVLRDTVDIDDEFYRALDKDLKRLAHKAEVNLITIGRVKDTILKEFKQEVDGKINFIGTIKGYGSPEFIEYKKIKDKALTPKEDILSARWTNHNYF